MKKSLITISLILLAGAVLAFLILEVPHPGLDYEYRQHSKKSLRLSNAIIYSVRDNETPFQALIEFINNPVAMAQNLHSNTTVEFNQLSENVCMMKTEYRKQPYIRVITVLPGSEETVYFDSYYSGDFSTLQNACMEYYREKGSFPLEPIDIVSFLPGITKVQRMLLENCSIEITEDDFLLKTFLEGKGFAKDSYMWFVVF